MAVKLEPLESRKSDNVEGENRCLRHRSNRNPSWTSRRAQSFRGKVDALPLWTSAVIIFGSWEIVTFALKGRLLTSLWIRIMDVASIVFYCQQFTV